MRRMLTPVKFVSDNTPVNRPNPSGIMPTEFKVVVLPDEVSGEHKFKGQGGKEFSLAIPDTKRDQEQFAQQDGTIIAIAALAFTYASKDEWEAAGGSPPKIGDRVSYARYAGALKKGKDGKDYRIVNDKDIYAVLT